MSTLSPKHVKQAPPMCDLWGKLYQLDADFCSTVNFRALCDSLSAEFQMLSVETRKERFARCEALGVTSNEIRASVAKWLLDTNRAHNLEDAIRCVTYHD